MRCQYRYTFAVNVERQCSAEATSSAKVRQDNEIEFHQTYLCEGHLNTVKRHQHVESIKEIDSRLRNLE